MMIRVLSISVGLGVNAADRRIGAPWTVSLPFFNISRA